MRKSQDTSRTARARCVICARPVTTMELASWAMARIIGVDVMAGPECADRIACTLRLTAGHGHAPVARPCWSCGLEGARLAPDGLCPRCARVDQSAVPDLTDPAWPGHGLATSDVLTHAPGTRTVR